jgi:ArsR family transcriptional regulator
LFRLLGDEARLRLLRLVHAEQLNVSELTSILGIAQSGVSRHLGLLKDAGLVDERREGGFTFFRLAPALRSGENGFGPVWPVLKAQFDAAAATSEGRADDARLEEVRRVRKENFDEDFNQHGAAGERRQIVPGRSWAAWARALGHLLPPLEVADLGCGEGYLTIETARFAKRVVAVDRSETVLARAKALAAQRLRRASSATPRSRANAVSEPAKRRTKERAKEFEGRSLSTNIEWKRGELERLPLKDASVDVALLSQALHHAAHPARALAEATRILRPGGRVLVLDLRRHDEQWVRDRLGDKWLGFEDAELARLLKDAGLIDVNVTVGTRRQRDPFTVLIASGVKPAAASSKRNPRHAR